MKELKLSVDAIGNKNFRFRANLTSENEFGKLGAAFNQSLENLGELDLANVVQQTLLPEKKFKQNNLTILTFSRYMSKLGGDCFSINKKENDVVSVFLGDISGHGIPAALNMAITRSILLYEENLGYPSETPLHALNKIFLSLRSAENKDYLTAQIIDFNSKDGSFSYINAGQTYPLLLKKNGEDAEYLKNVGLPVGFSKKAQYKAVSGTLENGDTLIMITDGFIEAFNDSKIMLGFDGFKELVKSSWDQDIDVFQNNILEGFKKWTKNPGDDISILLVRYEKE
jgi:sigma-B regulation protein RsbU (phosphoserine phosphatase)